MQPFNTFTVNFPPAGQQAQQVVFATDGGSVLLQNTSPNVTVYLSHRNTVNLATGDVSPLLPNSSVVFDGAQDIWAVTAQGQVAIVQAYPSATYVTPNTQVTPLVQGGGFTGLNIAAIAAGFPYTAASLIDVSAFTSYDINLYGFSNNPGAVASVLVFQVVLQWFDDLTSGIPVFEEDWWLYSGRAAAVAGNNYAAGAGPMHGRYMTVKIQVPLTCANNMGLQYFNLFGSNRVMPYSDWRQNSAQVNPSSSGITSFPGGGTGFDNLLCQIDGANFGANATIWIPLGLYAGPAYYHFQKQTAAADAHDTVLIQTLGLASGNIVVGTACPGVLKDFQDTAATTFEQDGQIILPRGPSALVISPGASGNNYTFSLQAQQSA